MQDFINHGLAIVLACLVITGFAGALIVLRPWKRRHRHRKRHSRGTRIDLFTAEVPDGRTPTDA